MVAIGPAHFRLGLPDHAFRKIERVHLCTDLGQELEGLS